MPNSSESLKTPGWAVADFRESHKLDQEGVDTLFGFASKGRACRRWEASGAPHYVGVIMRYINKYGDALAREMSAKPRSKKMTKPEAIWSFRYRHGLDQEAIDSLFGFSSKGRACRRWESEGAPYYVSVIMAYADRFGLALAEEMATANWLFKWAA